MPEISYTPGEAGTQPLSRRYMPPPPSRKIVIVRTTLTPNGYMMLWACTISYAVRPTRTWNWVLMIAVLSGGLTSDGLCFQSLNVLAP